MSSSSQEGEKEVFHGREKKREREREAERKESCLIALCAMSIDMTMMMMLLMLDNNNVVLQNEQQFVYIGAVSKLDGYGM